MERIIIQNTTAMKRRLIYLSLLLLGLVVTLPAQDVQRVQPNFWWGFSGAANVNMYTGTTQTLNPSLMVPAAFHDGFGVKGFGSLLLEYRPVQFFGFMLNLGYDNRGGAFDQVFSPCDCPADLTTNLSYATIQPSFRFSPFGRDFYLFMGGAYGFNVNKSFAYTLDQFTGDVNNTTTGDFGNVRRDVFSSHFGVGYDIQLAEANSPFQVALSPFVSYHPYFGQAPRDIESWSLSTVRIGVALKFGKGRVHEPVEQVYEEIIPVKTPVAIVADKKTSVEFMVRAPSSVSVKRIINEAFPLRNYIFFEKGSSEIPGRYVKLTSALAMGFTPNQLRTSNPINQTGRSARQMKVYYNILNVLGYRMNEHPAATITLIGAAAGDGEVQGRQYAESAKRYLVNVFGINSTRITTIGRKQPLSPSSLHAGSNFLEMLQASDRRVDIMSSSPNLLAPLLIVAEQVNPLDNHIFFTVESTDEQPLSSWNIDVTDENGVTKRYGPYIRKQESIAASTILGNKTKGTYNVVVSGKTPYGLLIKKESTVQLVQAEQSANEAMRFSILFEFDQSEASSNYEQFLLKEVAPNVVSNGTVIIHGYTDIVGNPDYNMQLSERRALAVRQVLEKAINNAGKTGVKFEMIAFGTDKKFSPFDNGLPEERFYNRTVIIDIIQP
jgi:outer membrane protein OmpA-like peptidoglycan-associated protein